MERVQAMQDPSACWVQTLAICTHARTLRKGFRRPYAIKQKMEQDNLSLHEKHAWNDVQLNQRAFPRGIGKFFTSGSCKLCNVSLVWRAPHEARLEHQASGLHALNYEKYKYAFSTFQLEQVTTSKTISHDAQERERLRMALVNLLTHPPDLHTPPPGSYSDC